MPYDPREGLFSIEQSLEEAIGKISTKEPGNAVDMALGLRDVTSVAQALEDADQAVVAQRLEKHRETIMAQAQDLDQHIRAYPDDSDVLSFDAKVLKLVAMRAVLWLGRKYTALGAKPTPAAPINRTNDSPPPAVLTEDQIAILRRLGKAADVAVKRILLEKDTSLHQSEKTIGTNIKRLRELGLSAPACGERSGESITPKGQDWLARNAGGLASP